MKTLLHLKSAVSERITGVEKELAAISDCFKRYEEIQREQNGPLLKNGVEFYESLLTFDGSQIMLAIEEEI
jgi:hypothetical protein